MMKPFKYYSTPSVFIPNRTDYKRYNVFFEDQVYGLGLTLEEVLDLPQLSVIIGTIVKSPNARFDPHVVAEFCKTKHNIHIIPYIKEAEYRQHKVDYINAEHALQNEFQKDLFEEFDVIDNPKAQDLFAKAWDRSISAGYQEVYSTFEDLVDLIK